MPTRRSRAKTIQLDIDSTAIGTATYRNGKLYVEFARDGSQYIYNDVPKSVAQELEDADSAGQYFNDEIRDNYDFD